jgi:hypothetical protein
MTHLIILACWNALIASCLKVSNKQEFTWPMYAIRELENVFTALTSYLFELALRKFATELTTVRVLPWSFMFSDHCMVLPHARNIMYLESKAAFI